MTFVVIMIAQRTGCVPSEMTFISDVTRVKGHMLPSEEKAPAISFAFIKIDWISNIELIPEKLEWQLLVENVDKWGAHVIKSYEQM